MRRMDAKASATLPIVGPPVTWSRRSILFSACNEDSRSELRALASLESKDVFCVTAGGGRVLALLLQQPSSITAVDLNPAQSALLELKVAAMRALDHGAYLEFLGVRPAQDRITTYGRIRRSLTDSATRFFDENVKLIDAGILFMGRLERYLANVAKVARLAHPFGLRALFESETLDEQRALVDRWETPLWRAVAHLLCRKSVLALLSGDPGFYRHLPPDTRLHEVLYDRIHRHLRSNLLRANPLLQLALYGRYVSEPSLPVYLHADTFDQIKTALTKVELDIVTGTVDEVLSSSKTRRFDAFSLSDISSYLDGEQHHLLFERVLSASRTGAAICSRANIYHRPPAPEHARRIKRNPELERKLAQHDHSCVHEFIVGSVGQPLVA
jgi:S-adenosylmethionine-diacylglycerol 3-amino-3-carboxypropyl transferase